MRKVHLDKEAVADLSKIDGIYLDKVPRRFYPNNNLASQLLGYVGVDNKGLAGIEFEHDNDLRGKVKKIKYLKDAKGRAIKYENLDSNKSSEDIVLSIDKDIQAFVEKTLEKALRNIRQIVVASV